VNNKHCFKLTKAALKKHKILATVYDNEALLYVHVANWFKRFIQGCENLEDDPRSGQPSTSQNV